MDGTTSISVNNVTARYKRYFKIVCTSIIGDQNENKNRMTVQILQNNHNCSILNLWGKCYAEIERIFLKKMHAFIKKKKHRDKPGPF